MSKIDPKKERNIPFNKPFIVGKELYNIARCVIEFEHLAGDGEYTRLCQKWLENRLDCRKAFLTHSCTAALEMTAILCNIKPGDEVIMPSYTFVSTANAIVLRGGTPVFIDIRSDTLNLDETLVCAAITDRTKAILPVHYAGAPCEMDTIMDIAEQHDLFVIEDAAQALLSTYRGKALGTIGHLGTVSFHETKNIISGEGGALLVNDERFLSRAQIIWEKGTDRTSFLKGEVDKYSWIDIGSSFLPSELVAAFLHAQIQVADRINQKRKLLYKHYFKLLHELQATNRLKLANEGNSEQTNCHLFYLILNSKRQRDGLLKHLDQNGIKAIFHYIPLHDSKAGKRYGRISGEMTNTVKNSRRIIRLPLYYRMEKADVEYVVEKIWQFFRENS